MDVIPISLGFLSDSRIHITSKYNLSKEQGYLTCPFDLMMTNYKGVIDCINDDFKDFCNLNYIEIKRMPGIEEDWIYHRKYNFLFNHESPGHANLYIHQNWSSGINHFINNSYENFITIYQNKIKNFRNYLNSGKHIIFILHRYNNNIDDLNELSDTIRNKYPKLSFEFELLQDHDFERIYCHQLMMGISDDNMYNESNRFNMTHRFFYLHKDYNSTIFKIFDDNNLNLTDDELKIKFLIYYLFKNTEYEKITYSLKTFYKNYPTFDYFVFRKLHNKEVENFTEEETIIYWYEKYYKLNIDINDSNEDIGINDLINIRRTNIIIYPHLPFNMSDGGVTVQYYLAQILDKLGVRVRIVDNNLEKNSLYNNIFNNDIEIDESIVVYCEGIMWNPLNAKCVVRWMLSPLGTNVPNSHIKTWNNKELVYYFNRENRFEKEKVGSIYKILTCLYINPNIVNYMDINRNGTCFTIRKTHFYSSIQTIHNVNNDFQITKQHTQKDYIDIFNKYKYFVLYDPLSFLMTIAIMCGCITIVHPMNGMTKLEWLHTTYYSPYLIDRNLENIYGIAYGMEDVEYAENSIHLAYEQIKDMEQYFMETIHLFINDIQNFENMQNTLENNYDLSKY
jgi:hypothetical protein